MKECRKSPKLKLASLRAPRLNLPAAAQLHKKVRNTVLTTTTTAMFQNICAIPFDHDLFTQAIHSSEPIVSVGLSSGHVQTYRLPAGASDDSDGDDTLASENGFGHIETAWKTRRHKGSCRALAFGIDGTQLFSAGTDGIVKVADVANGNVTAKIAIPYDPYVSLRWIYMRPY
jgi:WD40 repeat protein